MKRGIEVLAKPIFVRGVSPFNGRRTLRPNLSCGRFVYCGNWAGIEVLAKPIFVRGIAPSMAGAPCARTSHVGGSFLAGTGRG